MGKSGLDKGFWSGFGCVILLLIAGPLFIWYGSKFLFGGNYRDGNIAQYNAAVVNFTENRKPIIDATTATVTNSYTVGSLPLAVSGAIPVVVQGQTDGVEFPNWYNDSYFTVSNLVPTSTQNFSLTYNGIMGMPVVVAPPALTRTKTVSVRCSLRSGCSLATMQSYCESAAPSSCSNRATVTGSCSTRCSRNCSWTEDIADVCIVVRFANGMWIPDPEKTFCTYPFSVPQYGVCFNTGSSRPLTYRLRSNDDPFIVLQYLTEGSGSFGLTEVQQRALGLGFVIIGGIILSGLFLAGMVFLRSILSLQCLDRFSFSGSSAPVAVVKSYEVTERDIPLTVSSPHQKSDTDMPYPTPLQAL